MQRTVQTIVKRADAGTDLLAFLSRRFTYHTQEEWQEHIRHERILVDGKAVIPQTVLEAGQRIGYQVHEIPEPAVCTRYRIIYEDENLLAVDKPGNLPCHPAGPFFNHTLWALLKHDFPELNPRFVSRLDRETSGIVLVAKSAQVHKACQAYSATGQFIKKYVVLVEGRFPFRLHARGIMAPDATSPVRKKQRFENVCHTDGARKDGRSCETLFRRIGCNCEISQVEAELVTGRNHQIRATLCSLGYPVVGDKLYGVDDTCFLRFIEDGLTPEDRRKLRLDCQALHATELHVPHPFSGHMMHISSPIPKQFAALMQSFPGKSVDNS